MPTTAEDAALADELATAAGDLLLRLRPDEADRLAADGHSDRLVLDELSRRRPQDAVLSEESPDDRRRLAAPRVWIVDPLDGTKEYREPGRTDWAVHVALWQDGALTAGTVALPALGELWSAARPAVPRGGPPRPAVPAGGPVRPAVPAGGPVRPAVPAGGPVRRIAVSRTRAPAWVAPLAAELGAELVPLGSAGAKVAAVLRGEVDAYLHDGGQYEWDSAAPVAVAVAAGLHASRVDGTALEYNRPDPWSPDLMVCDPGAAPRLVDLVRRYRGRKR